MTISIIIGNCISLVAAFFTAKSSWSKDTWHIYFYQVLQCALLAVASIFFNSYAGIVTLLVCALRNYLAAIEKLDKKMTAACLVLVIVLGIAFNNRGYVGGIVIFANAFYTLGMYIARTEKLIKWNIAIDLVMWMAYEVIIIDIPSFVADFIALVVTIASLVQLERAQKKQ